MEPPSILDAAKRRGRLEENGLIGLFSGPKDLNFAEGSFRLPPSPLAC